MDRVRILGRGKGWEQCPDDDGVEIWGLNGLIFSPKTLTRVFMMDVLDEMPSILSGDWQMQDVIDRVNHLGIPLVAPYKYEEIPNSEAFPIQDAYNKFGTAYFNNTIAYMIAYALLRGVKEIEIWGINQASGTEYFYEKGCVEYWIGIAVGLGVSVSIHGEQSELLKNKSRYGGERLYGYHQTYNEIMKAKQKFGDWTIKKLIQPNVKPKPRNLQPLSEKPKVYDINKVNALWQAFNQHPDGQWIIGKNDAHNLASLIVENEPERILDLGTGIGASSSIMSLVGAREIHTVEQFEHVCEIAKNAVPKDLQERITFYHSPPTVSEYEEIQFSTYSELPEGEWDFIIIDGPGPWEDGERMVDLPNGDIFKLLEAGAIKEGGIVYVDGRHSAVKLIMRFCAEYLELKQSTSSYTIFKRTAEPFGGFKDTLRDKYKQLKYI